MNASLPVRVYRFWLKEMMHILPPTLYFFVAFNLISFTTNLLSTQSSTIEILNDIIDKLKTWPAAGSEDTELSVNMEPEVCHGTKEVYARVQA